MDVDEKFSWLVLFFNEIHIFAESPFYKHLEKWTKEILSQIILTILKLNVSLS